MSSQILVEVSARHIHLSKPHCAEIFGKSYELKKIKDLSQPGLFACQETVDIQIGQEILKEVRVVGPFRSRTQIEISRTDAHHLKIDAPLRLSGDLEDSQGCAVIGPQGVVNLKEGLIIAKRHLHLDPEEAQKLNLKNGQEISIKIKGKRELIFHKVTTRVDSNYKAVVHLDTDEGNAAGISGGGEGEIII
ncbi:MAG: phosphate propanoyltransferase [Candidatus Doudnabacteria bacterium]